MKIDHLALLARLNLSENEKSLFSRQVGSIIEYINTLNKLDTTDVEPTAHILPMKNIFREDELTPSLPREKTLKNAPEQDEAFFRVPRIIE